MTIKFEPFVFETSTSIGTGVFALNPQTGFRTISSAIGTGSTNEFYYFIRHKTVNEYEHGLGFIDGSGNLVRNSVILSSNADALVSFSVGTKDVTLDYAPNQIRNLDSLMATGLIDPVNTSIVSVNGGDNSKFDITVGSGRYSDAFTNPLIPVTKDIIFAAQTAVAVTNLATDSATFLYRDNTGALVQESELKGGEFLRDHVGIGILTHPDNATITGVSGFTPVSLHNTAMAMSDLSFCMGAINCATGGQNIVSGNSGTLGLDKSIGCFFLSGINARASNKDQNIKEMTALTKPVMFIGWTVTDNPEGKLIVQDTIPAGVFDDGTAVLADALPQGTVTGGQWVNNRIFMVVDSNQLAVQIGDTVYNSLANAKLGLDSEGFEPLPVLAGTTPIATVTMRGGATNLANIGDAEIRQAIPPRAIFK